MPDFCPAISARGLPGQVNEDRGRAEVEIGTFGIRTIAAILRVTRDIVGITLGHLSRPFEFSANQVESDEGVGSVLGWIRIAVAGRCVDRVCLEIDQWAPGQIAPPEGPNSWTPVELMPCACAGGET